MISLGVLLRNLDSYISALNGKFIFTNVEKSLKFVEREVNWECI